MGADVNLTGRRRLLTERRRRREEQSGGLAALVLACGVVFRIPTARAGLVGRSIIRALPNRKGKAAEDGEALSAAAFG